MNYRIATLLAIGLLFVSTSAGAQDSKSPADTAEHVTELISQLSHEKYTVREDAMRQLTGIGVAALPDLLKACTSETSETAWRAAQILEQIGLEGDVDDIKLVIRGMLSVAGQGYPHFERRCQKLAARYQEYKSEIAVQKIRAMGGQVNESPGYGVAQAGVRFIGPFDGGRVMIAPRAVDARLIEKIRVLEAVKMVEPKEVEKPDDGPREDSRPDDLKEPDANGRDCGIFDEEDEEDQQVQQVEAIIDLDVVPDDVVPDDDAFEDVVDEAAVDEPFEALLREFDGALTGLKSPPTNQVMRSITIDANWTGGVEGLSYLSKVNNLNYLQMQGIDVTPAVFAELAKITTLNQLSIDECSFSVSEIQGFASKHPDIYVRVTGKGVLGVMPTQGSGETSGCELNTVIEDSPAFKAGLQPGDVIIRVDEHKVVDFPSLTYTVAGRDVGDTVKVKALRDGEELEFKITLGPRGAILP